MMMMMKKKLRFDGAQTQGKKISMEVKNFARGIINIETVIFKKRSVR